MTKTIRTTRLGDKGYCVLKTLSGGFGPSSYHTDHPINWDGKEVKNNGDGGPYTPVFRFEHPIVMHLPKPDRYWYGSGFPSYGIARGTDGEFYHVKNPDFKW